MRIIKRASATFLISAVFLAFGILTLAQSGGMVVGEYPLVSPPPNWAATSAFVIVTLFIAVCLIWLCLPPMVGKCDERPRVQVAWQGDVPYRIVPQVIEVQTEAKRMGHVLKPWVHVQETSLSSEEYCEAECSGLYRSCRVRIRITDGEPSWLHDPKCPYYKSEQDIN